MAESRAQNTSTTQSGRSVRWAETTVTILVGIAAACFAWPQIFPGPAQANEATLPNLTKRAEALRQISDPVQREQLCIGLSAYGRALDRALPKTARIFMAGVVGKDNSGHMGFFYFLRNYLFPRDVEISLGIPPKYTTSGWVEGQNCNSPEMLKTNGFDLLLQFDKNGNIQLVPLTEKGVPKQ